MKTLLSSMLALVGTSSLAHGSEGRIPTVAGSFQIEYDVVKTELMTQSLLEDSLRGLRNDLKGYASTHPTTPSKTESILKDARAYYESRLNKRIDEKYRLTISSDGKALLVKRDADPPDHGGGPSRVVIDSKGGLFTKGSPNTGVLRERLVSVGLEDVPFVGFTLPNLPFQQGDKYLDTSSVNTRGLVYSYGRVEMSGVGVRQRVHRLLIGSKGRDWLEITLGDYRGLRDGSVAGRIQVVRRHQEARSESNGTAYETTEYRLRGIKPAAPPPGEFDPNSYLESGESVTVEGRNGVQRAINFDPTKGDLLAQLQEDQLKQMLGQGRQSRSKSSAAAGGAFAMLALGGIGCYAAIRSKRRQT